jgi:hypothetical protein
LFIALLTNEITRLKDPVAVSEQCRPERSLGVLMAGPDRRRNRAATIREPAKPTVGAQSSAGRVHIAESEVFSG